LFSSASLDGSRPVCRQAGFRRATAPYGITYFSRTVIFAFEGYAFTAITYGAPSMKKKPGLLASQTGKRHGEYFFVLSGLIQKVPLSVCCANRKEIKTRRSPTRSAENYRSYACLRTTFLKLDLCFLAPRNYGSAPRQALARCTGSRT
jgi:hypothetical protein